ncbi:MAG: glycoside hydrolase family 3 protein [Bacillota bacterium]|nr:glycoside hydrolase family 3 protein [Bacillota bacterium]
MWRRVKAILLLIAFLITLAYLTIIGLPEYRDLKKQNNDNAKTGVSKVSDMESKAKDVLNDMTLEEKVYQMFMVTPEAVTGLGQVTQAGDTTKEALNNYPVGGIIYFAQNFISPDQTSLMIKNTQKFSKIPLFIGVDEEGGKVARLGNNDKMGVTKYPPMAQVGKTGDENKAYDVGKTLGKELSDLGFNLDFAPVSDIVTNPENKVIGDRAFSTDAKMDAKMVSAVVKGLQENKVSACLKHFPGHGSTSADTHNGYAQTTRTEDELKALEFIPFEAGIKEGSDFVMVSHISAVNIDSSGAPATLSEKIVGGLLRGNLGFNGIIITDAMNMGAIVKNYSPEEAAALSVLAGCDIILMPEDLKRAADGVIQAINSGKITEARINESVLRILTLKAQKGMLDK